MHHGFITESLPWVSPLAVAAELTRNEACFVFLYSGLQSVQSGRYSLLALHAQETVSGSSFSAFTQSSDNRHIFDNAWFGYLGYELLHDIENIKHEQASYITLPDLWLAKFGLIILFDHEAKSVISFRAPHIPLPQWHEYAAPAPVTLPEVTSLASPMSREQYLAIIEKTVEAIRRGDFYQANITRKFTGTFAITPDRFALFTRLCEVSPASYSALICIDDHAIISSSPECFLTISSEGCMESRPIKGTAPRFTDKETDNNARESLSNSVKDRAENMMIVDLMRNDFARSCEPGSVKVEKLFEIISYATVHHMVSTVTGRKRKGVSTLEAVKSCFPPGSMTGAPKVKAMQWCMENEKIRRGIYSGALGWFGGDGSCNLSVIIRTLITEGTRFEFQVGGGIVADSEPEKEWQETIAKARGIMTTLGIKTCEFQ